MGQSHAWLGATGSTDWQPPTGNHRPASTDWQPPTPSPGWNTRTRNWAPPNRGGGNGKWDTRMSASAPPNRIASNTQIKTKPDPDFPRVGEEPRGYPTRTL